MNTDRPWMTALEMQFLTLALARKSVEAASPERRNSPLYHAEFDVVRQLRRSDTFAWSADTARAVWTASTSIPDDAVIDSLGLLQPGRSQWWWFDWPLPIPMDNPIKDGTIDAMHICAYLIEHVADGAMMTDGRKLPGMAVTEFRTTSLGPMTVSFGIVPEGKTLREVLDGARIDVKNIKAGAVPHSPRAISTLRFVLAASVWLKQRIISVGSGHIERHRRKQLAREHDAVLSDVKVVELRRYEPEPRVGNEQADPVEWSCRWVVDGHWRNQYHPSTGKHELLYILPYIKGPDDKPLRIPKATVYAVRR